MAKRILLDSNIWRYIVDAGALSTLQIVARSSRHRILASPAVLFEAAHSANKQLRASLLVALTRPEWKRLMPEAYWEAEELKGEVRRIRPEWLRPRPDLNFFKRVRHDWIRSKGGVWDRIIQEAHLLQKSDSEMIKRARDQAYALRNDALKWSASWESAPLSKLHAYFSSSISGWDGTPVEPWRVDALNVFKTATLTAGHPSNDWLKEELNLALMLSQSADLTRFWLHEANLQRMPRHWLRWAFEFLQRFRKVNNGTPVDIQLGTYLVDADFFMSADKTLIQLAARCRLDAPFKVAESVSVPAGDTAVGEIIRLLRS